MTWMETTLERRKSPIAMWDEAKTAIMLGMNYGPDSNPLETLSQKSKATISVYARNRDYHDIIKGKLKTLAGWLASKSNQDVKVFVDTAPLMEKPLAKQAGLGWQGKHTNLVSRDNLALIFVQQMRFQHRTSWMQAAVFPISLSSMMEQFQLNFVKRWETEFTDVMIVWLSALGINMRKKHLK